MAQLPKLLVKVDTQSKRRMNIGLRSSVELPLVCMVWELQYQRLHQLLRRFIDPHSQLNYNHEFVFPQVLPGRSSDRSFTHMLVCLSQQFLFVVGCVLVQLSSQDGLASMMTRAHVVTPSLPLCTLNKCTPARGREQEVCKTLLV